MSYLLKSVVQIEQKLFVREHCTQLLSRHQGTEIAGEGSEYTQKKHHPKDPGSVP